MTLNGVMAITLHYFSEVGKTALQKTICGGMYARVHCFFSACTMSSQRKFTFAISSPDEFLVCEAMALLQEQSVRADLCHGEPILDPECVSRLLICSPYLDDFQNLTGSFFSTDTSLIKFL